MLLTLLSLAAAAPVVGVDVVPLSRADLAWAQSDQLTGTWVGEFDGLIRPPLTPYVGLHGRKNPKNLWVLGLSGARTVNTVWSLDQRRRIAVTGIRPAVDLQHDVVGERAPGLPTVWVGAGLYGVIPIARDTSPSYGEEEQQAAREGARAVAMQVGGIGGRAGVGVDYTWTDRLSLGARAHWTLWRGQVFDDDTLTTSALGWVDVGLRLQVQL